MNLVEVGKLLAVVASYDNRRLDESVAQSWKLMLDREVPAASLLDAQEVVLDWFAQDNPYFEVRHLVQGLKKRLRLLPGQIAEDVRSARARGLVSSEHALNEPLPFSVKQRLMELRAGDRAVAVNSGAVVNELTQGV